MKHKDIIFILLPTLILVFAWIAFGIYHNTASTTITGNLNKQIVPINPDFDMDTIEKLKQREFVEPIYELTQNASSPAQITKTVPVLETSESASTEFIPESSNPVDTSSPSETGQEMSEENLLQ